MKMIDNLRDKLVEKEVMSKETFEKIRWTIKMAAGCFIAYKLGKAMGKADGRMEMTDNLSKFYKEYNEYIDNKDGVIIDGIGYDDEELAIKVLQNPEYREEAIINYENDEPIGTGWN